MADYFFNFIPQPNNLYRKLARRIIESNWNGSLATINYERLLELSLVYEGLKPISNKLKIYHNEIELCFPHGCCNTTVNQFQLSGISCFPLLGDLLIFGIIITVWCVTLIPLN